MSGPYIRRSLEPLLVRVIRDFPAVMLTGPRQAGKTTILQRLLGDQFGHVSLDLPENQRLASTAPREFLAKHRDPVIFDEVQQAPGIIPYLKAAIDEERGRKGRYILTGSQNLLLAEAVTESLAGRVAILRLFPLSRREVARRPDEPLPWEDRRSADRRPRPADLEIWESFLLGGYPELIANKTINARVWHDSYIDAYLQRDVRSVRQVGDLSQLLSFVQTLAHRSGQLVNLADIARDLGIRVTEARAWLSALEATYQVCIVRPYFANFGKRLVKRPKVYFTDVGTLCRLLDLEKPAEAASSPMAGAILETAVLGEIVKTLARRGTRPSIFFWRTSDGHEVDFLVRSNGRLVPIEVKLSASPGIRAGNPIRRLKTGLGDWLRPGFVIYPGKRRTPLGDGVTLLPFAEL